MSSVVKWFTHTMQGAPQLSNDWGCMTALLDAVLINGFNLKSVSSIMRSASVATVSIPAGHLFEVDQLVSVSGADQASYNGEFRVLSTTANTLTYAVSGSPTTPASTSTAITIKAAPLGWETVFTGTSKRAYRSTNPASNRPFLRVDDGCDPVWNTNYVKYARITLAQGMSDIGTFVGARAPFDSSNPSKNEVGSGSGATASAGWFTHKSIIKAT
jgi:hypothetical protein